MPARSDLVIGTAGHIDHGKTALVRALTGVDTDRLPAEKRRGITIDLGFAALDLPGGHRLALVDVPGHERFIRNMLAGASGLDLALLVIAADDSVMPQTREHLEILRLLGLSGGVIALTKVDLVDSAWLALVQDEVRALAAGTFLEGAEIVATSSPSGRGIDQLKASLARLAESAPPRADSGLFRMAIDRAFTLSGHGTVVTGTVASGSLHEGAEVEWFPSGKTVRVRGLHQHNRGVPSVARGARAAINLAGVHHAEIVRGHELATPGYLHPTRVLTVEVAEVPNAPRPLRHRGRYRLHLGTAEVAATLSLLPTDPKDQAAPRLGQLLLGGPVVSVHGQPFVLREESPPTTIGGGKVLAPTGRRLRRRDLDAWARVERLRTPDPTLRLQAALAGSGLRSPSTPSLVRDTGLAIVEVSTRLEALEASGRIVSLSVGPRRSIRVLAEVATALEARALRAIARLHDASPRLAAIVRPRVASALADWSNDALVAAILDRLQSRKRIVGDSRTVALADHQPKLSQGERKLKAEIAEAYRLGGFTPPDPADWASAKAASKIATVNDLLAILVDEERVVALGPGLFLDHDFEAELRRRVLDRLKGPGGSLTMAELRDLLGTSRKFAVPIGEYLDRIGWTTRDGDARVLGPRALIGSESVEVAP